jgi:hypothetical protein
VDIEWPAIRSGKVSVPELWKLVSNRSGMVGQLALRVVGAVELPQHSSEIRLTVPQMTPL